MVIPDLPSVFGRGFPHIFPEFDMQVISTGIAYLLCNLVNLKVSLGKKPFCVFNADHI